ncbi:hypothetical protein ACP4OV_018000 [Aristida adscensionis]
MMARSEDPDASPGTAAAVAGEIWGTWEELLLACAVRRHGTGSWDSVAMEVQARCPSPAAASLTPASCRLRYRVIHRRFAAAADENGGGDGGDEDPDAAAAAEWVEELRKLRVAELRREVERYDLSIGSLQSKVKRLTEERERSISGEAEPPAVKEEEVEEAAAAAVKGSPEDAAAGEDRVSGGASGRSCKESNSSDLHRPGPDASTSAAADDGDGAAEVRGEEEAGAGESAAVKREVSGESAARSKEDAAADGEESSDVQSSASPSRRREREGGDEAEPEEEASPSPSARAPLPAAEAEALLAFLETVRTSKPGAVFERRLDSQDGAEYRATIRRHVDLGTVRSKLEAGGAASYYSASELYRDLLLLCANALVFFPRGSPEHAAAEQTRALVSRHMSASLRKDEASAAAAAAAGASKNPKTDADVAGPLLEKAKPIIVCRKRSSIAKAAAAAAKVEKPEKESEEEQEEDDDKGKVATTKDKVRGLRSNKTRGRGPAKGAGPNQRKGKGSETTSAAVAEGTKKADKKNGGGGGAGAAGGVVKKRNAVDFLNRMKQNATASTERVSLLETLKISAAAEQKKAGKGEGQKETRGGSGSKRGVGSPRGRRNIGRPPKRAAAPPTPPPSKRAKADKPTRKRGGKR